MLPLSLPATGCENGGGGDPFLMIWRRLSSVSRMAFNALYLSWSLRYPGTAFMSEDCCAWAVMVTSPTRQSASLPLQAEPMTKRTDEGARVGVGVITRPTTTQAALTLLGRAGPGWRKTVNRKTAAKWLNEWVKPDVQFINLWVCCEIADSFYIARLSSQEHPRHWLRKLGER